MAAKTSFLEKALKRLRREGIKSYTKKSQAWFLDMLRSGKLYGTARRVENDPNTKTKGRPIIGKMYLFKYDPKYKETLPYYDRYPLAIICDFPAKKGKGFYGINMHYLSPLNRLKLLNSLMDLSTTNKTYKKSTKLKITYNILKSAQKYRAFKPCFKHYLSNHVQGKIIEIPPEYWEICACLPTHKFKGAKDNTVWNKSIRKVKQR